LTAKIKSWKQLYRDRKQNVCLSLWVSAKSPMIAETRQLRITRRTGVAPA